jgi:hypothetical protein
MCEAEEVEEVEELEKLENVEVDFVCVHLGRLSYYGVTLGGDLRLNILISLEMAFMK